MPNICVQLLHIIFTILSLYPTIFLHFCTIFELNIYTIRPQCCCCCSFPPLPWYWYQIFIFASGIWYWWTTILLSLLFSYGGGKFCGLYHFIMAVIFCEFPFLLHDTSVFPQLSLCYGWGGAELQKDYFVRYPDFQQ